MTPGQQWAQKMRAIATAVKEARVIYYATTGTMLEIQDRVFNKGMLTNGSKISYNEDYEVWGYKPPLPVKPTGKGKHGAAIKGGYYPTYLGMKAQQSGRDKTPFELSGDLRQAWAGGPRPEPTELNPLVCVIDLPEKEFKKAEGLAKQKGEFFRLTEDEITSHNERVRRLYRQLL